MGAVTNTDDRKKPGIVPRMDMFTPTMVDITLSLGGNHTADNFTGILYIKGCPIASKVCPTNTY